jgi:SSS family solute:Na+ symporter
MVHYGKREEVNEVNNPLVTIGGIAYNFIIILICSLIIISRRKKSNREEDFLFGGRQMGWFAIAASMALTALGGGHINGLSAQSWGTGVATIFYCFGAGLCLVIIMRFTGVWYRRSGCHTVNEMFGKLFHPALTPVLSGFCVGYCWLILCVETQGLAQIISSMTGVSNLTGGIIGIVIGILYVCVAGVEEIGLVNSVNAILMYVVGFITLACMGIYLPGGWENVNGSLLASNPELLHALGNPAIIRGYVIGTFLSLSLGMNFIQSNCQAVASSDDLRVMRKAGIGAVVMNVMFGAIIISMGLASKALVDQGVMESAHGAEGLVVMILQFLPNWLQIGIIGVFCAAMLSTVAMVALTIAVMLNKDILCYFKPFRNMSAKKEAGLSRVWVILASISAAFAAVTIQAQTNTAITWGFSWFIPLFFMFIIGLYWKRSQTAAIAAIAACWICNILLSFTNLAAVFNLEGNNHSIFLCVLSVVFGVIITALDKNAKPPFRKLYAEQRAAYDARRAGAAKAN